MELKIIIIRILFFCIIPIGIFVLVKAIKLLKKNFSGKIIKEFPLTKKSAEFEITKDGTCSIWEKSHSAKLIPAVKFKSKIQNNVTGQGVIVSPSTIGQSVRNGQIRRMQLFLFSAKAGNYSIEVNKDPDNSGSDKINPEILPVIVLEDEKYFIQVRESQADKYILFGILLVIISVCSIACGFIFGINAERIF